MPSIYEKVKIACSEANISVYGLEKELGFPRSSICKWGKNTPGVDKKIPHHLSNNLDSKQEGSEKNGKGRCTY